ncbi:hypothetical protein EJD97_008280 [Solanum chilense]|uniref:Uncharacterized protein n=2 Tax=Solanum subgen. Lycopersicon TaxID=49274 RepID=A0A3Q7HJC2_SOLLC|nr:hypothetical protein EJD97_008280 [Solanum chilense]
MKESGSLLSFKNRNGGDSHDDDDNNNNNSRTYKATSLRRRFRNLCSRKKKSLYKLCHHRFVEFILFKIASLLEAIAMVATLVFFFFRYGFHI